MRLVVVETPYAARTKEELEENLEYARAALCDCFVLGEAPFASHLLYTQEGVLDDVDANQRALGMRAGFAWGDKADATVVYIDRGISKGMRAGITRAERAGRPVEYRTLVIAETKKGPAT